MDIKAFHKLFVQFQPQLKSYLYRFVTDRNDAEDLAHDTFILGTGSFAQALGKALQHNHKIVFGSRNPQLKKEWAQQISATAEVVSPSEAVTKSRVVIIALPWPGQGVVNFINSTHHLLTDKVLIDGTNVLNSDYSPLQFNDVNS